MIRTATLSHGGVVGIKGEERIAEFTHVEASVAALVVASDEKVKLFARREDSNSSQSFTQLSHADVTAVVDVEDLECICQVEVTLESEGRLFALDIILVLNECAKAIYQLILVTQVEHRLPRWAGVAWERLRAGTNRRAGTVG